MCAFVLPLVYFIPGSDDKHYEYVSQMTLYINMITRDALDAAVMIKNNKRLLGFVLLYWMSIAFYNFFGLSVARKLTAVHRTFIDAIRTIFVPSFPFYGHDLIILQVWGAEIILFYALHGATGEKWTRYSYIELAGFALLVLGTATYNTSIKYPCFKYPPKI